ncbi:MAG: CHAT domain-containing protein, partial [Planctomycetota bacterium]
AGTPEGKARVWSEGFRNEGRWKGHALLEGIAEHRRGARTREAIAIRREVREILAERDRLLERVLRAIREGRPAEDIASLRTRADELLARAMEKERRLASISPRDASLDRPTGAEVEAVRAAIGEGTALIEYAEGTSRLYAYLLTSDRFEFLDLAPLDDVGKAVQAFLACVSTHDPPCPARVVSERGRSLFETLLAPAIRTAGRKPERLLVVPTATLASLPFEALVTGKPEKEGPWTCADLEFVLDGYEVAYAPSSPVIAELASVGPRRAPGRALVLADPVYRGERPATSPASRPQPGLVAEAGGEGGADLDALQSLPSTRGEAEAIARAWLGSEDATSSTILDRLSKEASGSASSARLDLHWGEEASRRPLVGDLRGYTVIHVAAHGFVDLRFPRRTRIALSPDREGRGQFSIVDALDLDLDADLVALSACNTAQGGYRRGEGVESLARAFLFAGARGVIASLWLVEDRAGATTMSAFYRRWSGSGGASRALLEAKRALRHSKELPGGGPAAEGIRGVRGLTGPGGVDPAYPYFWAPFIYIGLPR